VKGYHINCSYSEEAGSYIADIPDLEARSAFGATVQEAVAAVLRAKRHGSRRRARPAGPSRLPGTAPPCT
jgi:hypothetical protein